MVAKRGVLCFFLIALAHVGEASDASHGMDRVREALAPSNLVQTAAQTVPKHRDIFSQLIQAHATASLKTQSQEPGLIAKAFPNPFSSMRNAKNVFPDPTAGIDRVFPLPKVQMMKNMFPDPIGDPTHPDTEKSLIIIAVIVLVFILSSVLSYFMQRKKDKSKSTKASATETENGLTSALNRDEAVLHDSDMTSNPLMEFMLAGDEQNTGSSNAGVPQTRGNAIVENETTGVSESETDALKFPIDEDGLETDTLSGNEPSTKVSLKHRKHNSHKIPIDPSASLGWRQGPFNTKPGMIVR